MWDALAEAHHTHLETLYYDWKFIEVLSTEQRDLWLVVHLDVKLESYEIILPKLCLGTRQFWFLNSFDFGSFLQFTVSILASTIFSIRICCLFMALLCRAWSIASSESELGVKFKFFSEFRGNQANNQIRSLINCSWSVQKVQCLAMVCKAMTKLSTVSPSSCQRQSSTPSKRTLLHTMKCLSNVVFTVWYCFS